MPVTRLESRLFRVPLRRPWGTEVPAVHLIVTEVETVDGVVGTGFSWTPSVGAQAVLALLRHDIEPLVVGGPSDPGVVWDRLWLRLHEAGGGGLTTMAMAAVDIALWDASCRRAGVSLVERLGRRQDSATVYGSGVNFHYSLDELVEQARRWVARGLPAVKIKVGHDELEHDVERVAAVRRTIGDRVGLMIDANQRWDLPTALRAIDRLAAFDLRWVEEPLLSDDLEAHARLRARTSVPIALGESVYTEFMFQQLFSRGLCDFAQPNVVRVGGITPFRRICALARTFGVTVAPHLLPDLSAQLAMCLPERTLVEDVEDASFEALGVLDAPSGVRFDNGTARVDTGPGHGLRFGVDGLDELEPLSPAGPALLTTDSTER